MIPIGLYCIQRLEIFSQFYSPVLSSTRPYQALTIRYNNPNDLSEKLSLSTNSSFPILPAKNQLLVEPGQSPAHRKRETDSLKKSVETKNFPTAPSTPPTPSRLLLPGYFTSSPPPCWLAGWQRVGGPPPSYPLITELLHPKVC